MQIRPRRLRHVVASSDTAMLLLLFVAFAALLFATTAAIVRFPLAFAIFGPLLGLALGLVRWGRAARLAAEVVIDPPPPPRRVA